MRRRLKNLKVKVVVAGRQLWSRRFWAPPQAGSGEMEVSGEVSSREKQQWRALLRKSLDADAAKVGVDE